MTLIEKTGLFISLGVIVVLLLLMVFAKQGIMDQKVLKQTEALLTKELQDIEQKNKLLESEINKLKTDLNYIKHVAKHELDMTEENELIFREKSGSRKGDTP